MEKRFRPSSQDDISDAVVLSCYLYVLGQVQASIDLLNSFLYFDYREKPESQRHLWVDNCEGLLLLAYIQGQAGLDKIQLDLKTIMGEDSQVDPKKFMKGELKYFLDSSTTILKTAESETPKHQCLSYAQQVLRFISVVVLWPYFSKRDSVNIWFKTVKLSTVEELLAENISLLRQSLEKTVN